jgi:hypothetical protein
MYVLNLGSGDLRGVMVGELGLDGGPPKLQGQWAE